MKLTVTLGPTRYRCTLVGTPPDEAALARMQDELRRRLEGADDAERVVLDWMKEVQDAVTGR